jgi:hypothetical protein
MHKIQNVSLIILNSFHNRKFYSSPSQTEITKIILQKVPFFDQMQVKLNYLFQREN